MKLKLRHKITLTLIVPIVLIYLLAFLLVFVELNLILKENLIDQSRKSIKNNTLYFSALFDKDVELLRALKNALLSIKNYPYDKRIELQNKIISEVLYETPEFLSLGVSWELRYVLPNYEKTHGRYRYLYYIDNGKLIIKIDTLNVQQEALGSLYYSFKINKKDDITDIYYDSYTGRKEDMQLMNSIGIPFLINDNFIGLIACDISLERLSNIAYQLRPFDKSQVIMISHSGKIVANTDKNKYINESLSKIFSEASISKTIYTKIQESKSDFFEYKDSLGRKFYVFFEPFYFGKVNRAWGIIALVPQSIIIKSLLAIRQIVLWVGIIGFFLIIVVIYVLTDSIINPIKQAVTTLKRLAKFDISEQHLLTVNRTDEIGEIMDSLNTIVIYLNKIKEVTQEISRGNLDISLKPVSEYDTLSGAINEMQRSLKISQIEDEKRREEEQIQRMVIEGESKISEILRDYSNDLEKMCYEIVSFVVKYTNSAQGALFLVDHNNEIIELVAAYAYDRKKILTKKIPFGVGLLGRAVKEGEMIYITDVPEGYTSIVSGLGQEEPRTILIIPFKFNEVIYALLELASFKGYKLHVRNFLQRVGINIASTIANIRITQETNKLVNELKQKTQELTTQQEEMRQNLEEMKTTQEELRRKNMEYENIVTALNQVSYVIVYNMDREIIDANQNILTLFKKTKDQLIGIKQGAFNIDPKAQQEFDLLWKNLQAGRISRIVQNVEINGRKFTFSEAYIPILDENGNVYKVINIANDITNILT